MSIIEHFIGVIAPHTCVGCGAEYRLLCSVCMAGLPKVPSRCYRCHRRTDAFRTCRVCRTHTNLHTVYAATQYDGLAKELVKRLKFGRAVAAAQDIAQSLAAMMPPQAADYVIVPIPTANNRVRQRGYDQAVVIAQALARQTGWQYTPLLRRVGDVRQLGQTRQVRQTQMSQAYIVPRPLAIQNKHILFIDDVLTTGATIEAAARAAQAAGAQHVSAMVFAVA